MSATIKLNLAVWGAVIALVVSVGGVLIGAGMLMAEQRTHRRDIDRNTQAVDTLKGDIKQDLIRIQSELKDQMRNDKAELLTAIRNRP